MLTLSFMKDDCVYCYRVTLCNDLHSKYNSEPGTTQNIFLASKRSGNRYDRLPLQKLWFQLQGEIAYLEGEENSNKLVHSYMQFLSQFDYQLQQVFPVSMINDLLQVLEPTNLRLTKDLSAFMRTLQSDTEGYDKWNQIYFQQTGEPFLISKDDVKIKQIERNYHE